MSNFIAHPSVRCVLLFAIGAVVGCASHSSQSVGKGTSKQDVVAVAPGPHGHRFDMQQNGKRMTADEFDAWMKARGIRVATGAAKPKTSSTSKRSR